MVTLSISPLFLNASKEKILWSIHPFWGFVANVWGDNKNVRPSFREIKKYIRVLTAIFASSIEILTGIAAQARDRWQDNRRASCESEINFSRWKQLKHLLESGKHKVSVSLNACRCSTKTCPLIPEMRI